MHHSSLWILKIDDFLKVDKQLFVIPAEAGIQSVQAILQTLDLDFHRGDDY